jgi:hypothetical protein
MRRLAVALCAAVAFGLSGCRQPQSDVKFWQPAPVRDVELDRLAVFVGGWEGTFAGGVPGETERLEGTSITRCTWEADEWALVERVEWRLGQAGSLHVLRVWRWDPGAGEFRVYTTDNSGGEGAGKAWYDVAANTWHVQCNQRDAAGRRRYTEMTLRFSPDNNTQEWEHREWDGWKLVKTLEWRGTSRRQAKS